MTTATLQLPADERYTADQLDRMTPDDWVTAHAPGISASEISAVLGISPWESPFSLYWRKRQGWASPGNLAMRAGKAMEPLIAAEFADRHPELTVVRCGMFIHRERTWQYASPDLLALDSVGRVIPIESKCVDHVTDEWGDDGSDIVPIHYQAQNLWQCDTLGATEGRIVAMFGHREIREYVIPYDEVDALLVRSRGFEFHTNLHDLDGTPPTVDDSAATTRTLKRLHPSIEDREVDINPDLAHEYLTLRAHVQDATTCLNHVENQIRLALGPAKRGMHDGQPLVSRSVYEQRRIDSRRLRAEHPDIADTYTRTSTVDRLNCSVRTSP